jgi:hypothetical protein
MTNTSPLPVAKLVKAICVPFGDQPGSEFRRGVVCEVDGVRTVGVHDPDVVVAGAVAREGDLLAVR